MLKNILSALGNFLNGSWLEAIKRASKDSKPTGQQLLYLHLQLMFEKTENLIHEHGNPFWGNTAAPMSAGYSLFKFMYQIMPRFNKWQTQLGMLLEYREMVEKIFIKYFDFDDEDGFGRGVLRDIEFALKKMKTDINLELGEIENDVDRDDLSLYSWEPNDVKDFSMNWASAELSIPSVLHSDNFLLLDACAEDCITILTEMSHIIPDQEIASSIRGFNEDAVFGDSTNFHARYSVLINTCFKALQILGKYNIPFHPARYIFLNVLSNLFSSNVVIPFEFERLNKDRAKAAKIELIYRMALFECSYIKTDSIRNVIIPIICAIYRNSHSQLSDSVNTPLETPPVTNTSVSVLDRLINDCVIEFNNQKIKKEILSLSKKDTSQLLKQYPLASEEIWQVLFRRIAELSYIYGETDLSVVFAMRTAKEYFTLVSERGHPEGLLSRRLQRSVIENLCGVVCAIFADACRKSALNGDNIYEVLLIITKLQDMIYNIKGSKKAVFHVNLEHFDKPVFVFIRALDCFKYSQFFSPKEKAERQKGTLFEESQILDLLRVKMIEKEDGLTTGPGLALEDWANIEMGMFNRGKEKTSSLHKTSEDRNQNFYRYYRCDLGAGLPPSISDLGSAQEIDEIISDFRVMVLDNGKHLGDRANMPQSTTSAEKVNKNYHLAVLSKSIQLKEILFSDHLERFNDVPIVHIIPSGELFRVPFNMLFHTIKDTTRADKIPVATSWFSLSLLVDFLGSERKQGRDLSNSHGVVFANPDYSLNGKYETSLEYLDASQREANSISNLLNAKVYGGIDASKKQFLSTESPVFLHVATHMLFNDLRRPIGGDLVRLFGPYAYTDINASENRVIALAGAARYQIGEECNDQFGNGVISGDELRYINLKGTKLVMLSGCTGGLVDQDASRQLNGFSYDCMAAGAECVISALWSVKDEVFATFAVSFYNQIKDGETIGSAFTFAFEGVRTQYPSVKDWGAFSIYGDAQGRIQRI